MRYIVNSVGLNAIIAKIPATDVVLQTLKIVIWSMFDGFFAIPARLVKIGCCFGCYRQWISFWGSYLTCAGLVSVDMGKFYSRMFDNRVESDYADWVEVEEQDMQAEFALAEEFVAQIAALINKQL